ncbi:MAG: DUF2306 domain-containing protein [Anaerolineales bacterium]
MKAKIAPSRKSAAALVAAALVLLSSFPLLFGALRLVELAGGPQIMPANARFVATPLPVVIHIVSAAIFALVGAFQFVTGYRKRLFGWHRAAGRVLVAGGLAVGLSGLWMTLFFPRPTGPNELLYAFRLVFGSAMVVSIVLGFEAIIRRRDVLSHRAWMMRAYAIGLGAGTQVLTGMVASFIVSQPTALSTALAQAAGWVINLTVAEWAIRRLPAQRARSAAAAASHSKREQPGAAR